MREILLLVAAAAIAFGGALGAQFYFDDVALFNDPAVTSADGWLRVFSPSQIRPLTWLTYWLNYRLGGANPFGYHLLNLLLHLAAVVAVRVALGRLLPASAALTGAAIFALHPIQTEAIAYVFSRPALLMTLFCALSLGDWAAGRHWRAAAWFVPALLAKEECVAFPAFLLLLHALGARNPRERKPIAVMFLFSLAAGLRVLYAVTVIPGSGAGAQAGVAPFDYFLTQGLALLRYARLLILPYSFSIEAPLEIPEATIGIGVWICVVVATLIVRGRYRPWIWGALLLIAPSSTFLPANDLAADRRVYLPLIALAAAAGLAMERAPRWALPALAIGLGAVSVRQTLVWRNGYELWSEAEKFAQRKPRPKIQLARYVPLEDALPLLDRAREVAPDDPAVAAEKGRVYLELNRADLALAEFGRALALAPNDASAINNRGVALDRLGQREAAIADFRRALEKDPCLFDALHNLRQAGAPLQPPQHCRYTPLQERLLRGN